MVLAKFANNATLTERRWYGIQSKTYEDAKKVCYLPIVDMVMRLPKYFRPLMASNDRPQQELLFRKPSSRLSAKKQSDDDEMYFDEDLSDGLNTKIDYKATDEAAYDGKKLYAYLMDEFSKWKEANPMDTYTTVKRSLTLGGNKIIYGKTFVLSTSDEKDSKSFMEWKSLWDTSDISKRAEDGKTISGLYRYPIFAYEGLEGFIDKYGNCDEDAAKKHLMMEQIGRAHV